MTVGDLTPTQVQRRDGKQRAGSPGGRKTACGVGSGDGTEEAGQRRGGGRRADSANEDGVMNAGQLTARERHSVETGDGRRARSRSGEAEFER